MTWAVIGRIPGSLVGAATLALLPSRSTTLLVGAIVFISVAMIGWGPKIRRTWTSLLGIGTVSGFMGTTATMGGPPMVVVYRDDSGPRIRGTMAGFFVVGLLISLTTLTFVGRFGRQEILAALALVPGIVIVFAISNYVAPIIDRGYNRKALLTISALVGLSVVLRALMSAP